MGDLLILGTIKLGVGEEGINLKKIVGLTNCWANLYILISAKAILVKRPYL
jgi:hypothetical protein